MNNPYYILKVDVFGCVYEFQINGLLLFKNNLGKGITITLPINHYLFNKENILTINLYPMPKNELLTNNSICRIAIQVYPDGTSQDITNILSYSAPLFDEEKPNISFNHSIPFATSIPFNDPFWKDSHELHNTPNITQQVKNVYKRIRNIFLDKNVDDFLKFTEIRENEIAEALYISINDKLSDTRESLLADFNDNQLTLSSENEIQNANTKFYSNNKIVCLQDSKTKSPIYFLNEKEGIITYYDFYLAMSNNEKDLIVVR